MLLSEMTTDQLTDCLCTITPYINNIITDEDLLNTLKDKMGLNEESTKLEMVSVGVEKANKIIPILLKTHKEDVYGIISAITGKSIQKVSKQPGIITITDIMLIVKDKGMQDFFTSLRG